MTERKRTCENCAAYHANSKGSDHWGECRLHAKAEWDWPRVSAHDWCMEWMDAGHEKVEPFYDGPTKR